MGHIAFIEPIISPQISITSLNGTSLSEYLNLYEKNSFSVMQQSPVFIEFQSEVKITGNVFTDSNSTTVLQKIHANAIGRIENAQIILGDTISFKEHLLVNHITMQINTETLVRQSESALELITKKSVEKQFVHSLMIDNNVIVSKAVCNSTMIHKLNARNTLPHHMNSLMESSRNLKQKLIFEGQLNAVEATADNFIERFDHSVDHFDINAVIFQIFNVRKPEIRSIIIDGAVQFNSTHNVNKAVEINVLNGLDLQRYMNLIVSTVQENQQKSIEIGGEKTFISKINTLFTHTIEFNQRVQTRDWIENSIRQQHSEIKSSQVIESSGWQFIDTVTDNCQTHNSINGVHTFASDNKMVRMLLVDDDPTSRISIESDISLSSFGKVGSHSELRCTTLRPCDIQNIISDTVHLSQTIWLKLNITGSVKVLTAETGENLMHCGLFRYFQNTVTSKIDEYINLTKSLKLESRDKFAFNRITSLSYGSFVDQQEINNIDLEKIFIDAVVSHSNQITYASTYNQSTIFQSPKTINGTKTGFDETVTVVSNEFETDSINDISVNTLNNTIFYQNDDIVRVLSWQKLLFIETLITKAINMEKNQTINGVLVCDLYFVYSAQTNQISSIYIQNNLLDSYENIELNLVNDMSLKYFIDNRLKLFSRTPSASYKMNTPQVVDGFFNFENLILSGKDIKIDLINDIGCDDAVLSHSNEKQQISGFKRIVGQSPVLYVQKPFHVWKINNFELVSKYAKTIALNREHLVQKFVIRRPYRMEIQKKINIQRKFNDISLLI